MSFPLGAGPSLPAPPWDASLDGSFDDSSLPIDPEQAMHLLRRQRQLGAAEEALSPAGLWSERTTHTRSPSASSSEDGDADDLAAAARSPRGLPRYVPMPRAAVRHPPAPTHARIRSLPDEASSLLSQHRLSESAAAVRRVARSLPDEPSSLLSQHRLNEPAAAVQRVARSLPIGSDGSLEVLVRLRAIAAHLAGTPAEDHERRALALALLSRGMVSHMTQMNHAQAHRMQFSATSTDHGVQARAVWRRQDAAQSTVNAVYMSLLSRLSNQGVLSREEVWRAVIAPPRHPFLPSYLCRTARTLAERPPQPSPHQPDAIDMRYAYAFTELLRAVLPMPTGSDDRSNFFRLGGSKDPARKGASPGPFFENLLVLRSPIGHAPLAFVCRALQELGAGFDPPRKSCIPAPACLGRTSMDWEKRFDAALGSAGGSPAPRLAPPVPGLGQRHGYQCLSEDLARTLDFVSTRQRWGLQDLVAKSPDSDILWWEENRTRQADTR